MTLRTLQIGMEWFSEQPGGLNRVYARLVSELSAMDVSVTGLVTGSDRVVAESSGVVRAFARHDAPMLSRLRAVRAAAMPFLHENTENDVVVSHFAPYALPLLDYIARRPFVVHFQGPWGQESLVEGASARSAALRERAERLVYRRADAAIVLSTSFKDILADRFGVKRERIHVIPGGVDADRFATPASMLECRAELGWPIDVPIVLCVRRLVRRVGLDLLIESAAIVRKRVPKVKFFIAGTGPLRDELLSLVNRLQLQDTVRLLGFIEERMLPSAYRAADLSVVPTTALEGFGLITAESLAAGTPCVVTPVDALTGIIAPLSPELVAGSLTAEALAETLCRTLLKEHAVPSAEACAEYARANFDWPVVSRKVKQVYESVLQ